ncbi:FAD-dependent oxidoreductase [Leucobacter weissii]|uniref:FAD-dependent oxidoreductase n=1 Tax=Leucobacter weissii TaxID=1983706 RepID=A0A939SBH5_9MICO|nr:FAD-dependent oxidoreductase [Leucobacter weissii]MBO1901378.1 FAD-dependent oxidoreductase [Leucobacter weissii]
MTRAERRRADRIVVGGGVMGLAAAAELGRRGASVLLLERFEPHHERGASHGATRNFNNAYAEADYLDLFAEARGLWRRLEAETGRALLDLGGLVTHGPDETVSAIHAALRARDARVELVSAVEAGRRWPGMRFAGDALVGLDAGVVRAAEALDTLSEAAVAHGAELRFGHRVVGIDAASDERVAVTVETGSGRRILAEAAGVVVAAGAWSAPLLGGAGCDGLVRLPELTVTEEHPAHFRARDAGLPWPSFNHIAHDAELELRGGHIYGMETPGEGVKVGFHAVGETVDPDRRPFGATAAKRRQLRAYVAEWFPGLDPDSAAEISCTYTSTASGDFVLDRVGPVTVGTGFSGHGFKFAPAVGRILADASLGLDAPPGRFRLAAHGR